MQKGPIMQTQISTAEQPQDTVGLAMNEVPKVVPILSQSNVEYVQFWVCGPQRSMAIRNKLLVDLVSAWNNSEDNLT